MKSELWISYRATSPRQTGSGSRLLSAQTSADHDTNVIVYPGIYSGSCTDSWTQCDLTQHSLSRKTSSGATLPSTKGACQSVITILRTLESTVARDAMVRKIIPSTGRVHTQRLVSVRPPPQRAWCKSPGYIIP